MLGTPAENRAGAAGSRCPHLLFAKVLGTETAAALLDYVVVRQRDFTPATVHNRASGQHRIDPAVRDCCRLSDLGPFEAPLRAWLTRIAPQMLDRLGLSETAVEPREFEICAYRDGGHFAAHSDTSESLERVRVLSCVYYFAAAPTRFSGGILRLHGFPTAAGRAGGEPPTVDIPPASDTLVVFPSWLRHEVLPVAVPSGAWVDGRFTINCWLHRASG